MSYYEQFDLLTTAQKKQRTTLQNFYGRIDKFRPLCYQNSEFCELQSRVRNALVTWNFELIYEIGELVAMSNVEFEKRFKNVRTN